MSRRAHRGFTLIELVITLAIIGIVGVLVGGIIAPQVNIYQIAADKTDAKSACNTVLNTITRDIRYGYGFSQVDGNPPGNWLIFHVPPAGDGDVNPDAEEYERKISFLNIDKEYPEYEGVLEAGFSINNEQKNIVITVTAYDAAGPEGGQELYTITQTVSSLNWDYVPPESEGGD